MTTADDDLTGRELEPAFRAYGQNLPAPHQLVGILRERLEASVLAARAERGEVHVSEDVFASILHIGSIAEGLIDYGRAFTTVGKEAAGYVEDELIAAVGEQEGVPLSGIDVPDPDGTTLKVTRDIRNEYDIDIALVIDGAVLFTLERYRGWQDQPEEVRAALLSVVMILMSEAARTVIACGTFKPQITKVRDLATEIARIDPKVASTITSALKGAKTTSYRGVKVKREQPK